MLKQQLRNDCHVNVSLNYASPPPLPPPRGSFFTRPSLCGSNKGGGQIKLALPGKVGGKLSCCESLSAEASDETLEDDPL